MKSKIFEIGDHDLLASSNAIVITHDNEKKAGFNPLKNHASPDRLILISD